MKISRSHELTKVKKLLENQQGSIIIETAIILPIVFVIILSLLTLSLLVHDKYVADLWTSAYIHEEGIINKGNEEVNIDKILKSVASKRIVKTDEIKFEYYEGIVTVNNNYDLPFLGKKNESLKRYKIDRIKPLKNIKTIELIEDVFDYLTFSDPVRTKYNTLLKTVRAILESY